MRLPFHLAVRDRLSNATIRTANDVYNMLYVGFPLGEATFLILGGPSRWQGEQFTYARMVPLYPYSWAAVFLIFAVILGIGFILEPNADRESTGHRRGWFILVGALGCAAWCVYYAVCSFLSGQLYPTQVSLTGPYLWSFLALWYVIKAGQHVEFGHPRETT